MAAPNGPFLRGIAAVATTAISVLATTPARADCFDVGGSEVCNNTNMPTNRQSQQQRTVPSCYLEQNALRPCNSRSAQAQKAPKIIGVDPRLVGAWTYRMPHGLWVLEVSKNGTYKFHSEAGDGAPSHMGSFGAMRGRWSLTATNGNPGWVDGGAYTLKLPDTWTMTGRLGVGAWRRRPSTVRPSAVTPTPRSGKR
jgi:hypothetical protein